MALLRFLCAAGAGAPVSHSLSPDSPLLLRAEQSLEGWFLSMLTREKPTGAGEAIVLAGIDKEILAYGFDSSNRADFSSSMGNERVKNI